MQQTFFLHIQDFINILILGSAIICRPGINTAKEIEIFTFVQNRMFLCYKKYNKTGEMYIV